MRKLTTKEQQKYITVKQYIAGSLTRKQAGVRLGVRPETISRLKVRYQNGGKQAFSHGNNANTHAASIDRAVVAEIVRLYKEDFAGFNFTHFSEILIDRHLIDPKALPTSRTVATILERHGIRSPVARLAGTSSQEKQGQNRQCDSDPFKNFFHNILLSSRGLVLGIG